MNSLDLRERRPRRFALVLTVIFAVAGVAAAQEADGPRHALVIGNAAYAHFASLSNPANDARDMAAMLRDLGFEVTELVDAGFAAMDEAVFQFGETLAREGGVGLFYYAGHGVEVDGTNYLVPVDQEIRRARELAYKAVQVDRVLTEMEAARNGTNIVILDACRDNPLPADARGGSGRGLSVVQAPAGSLVVYATAPGFVAQDGRGRNGVFTGALLEHIATPGLDVMDVLRAVRRDVIATTGGEQTPWENSSLTERFYFAPATAAGIDPALRSPGPRLELVPTYGEIEISVVTAGELYLDGERLGRLDAGQSARLQGVPTGTREVVMDYGEERETLRVLVRDGLSAAAPFEYAPAPEEPEWSLDTMLVQGGSFQMGSPSGGGIDERPVRTVTVDSFRMTTTEVTFAAYDAFARATGRSWPNDRGWGRGTRPVINVSWYDAVAYANWLSQQDGLTPAYRISGTNVTWNRGANGWRLPTEAEWEYAARGGTQSRGYTYAGSNSVGDVGWYSSNSNSRTQRVAVKRANELGLYDMSGNVWEWVWDMYGDYPGRSERNPIGPTSGDRRVLRGGSWISDDNLLRVADRSWGLPAAANDNLGFRLVAGPAR